MMATKIMILLRVLVLSTCMDMVSSVTWSTETLATAENITAPTTEDSGENITASTTEDAAENITATASATEDAAENITATASTTEDAPENITASKTDDTAENAFGFQKANATNNVNPFTVGPTKSEKLALTFLGIDELENEEEWSQYTATFLTHYFKVVGGKDVFSEVTIDINVENQQITSEDIPNYFCGCPTCTPDIWSTDACDDNGYCSTCGERINYLHSFLGEPMREACSQIAGFQEEYEEECGACNPVTCNRDTYCGCPQCTPEVWSREACDENGFCSTCGERITHLYKNGALERDACIRTAELEYGDCSPCNPMTCNEPTTYCGCPQCTSEVWTKDACDEKGFCSTCGERINFVQSILGQTERGACSQIAGLEYEEVCGPCDPSVCNAAEVPEWGPAFHSNKSVLVIFIQNSTFNTSDPFYVIQEPFAGTASQSVYIDFLQSQSSYYDAVVSVSPAAIAPPPSPPDDGIQTSSPSPKPSPQPMVAPTASSPDRIFTPPPNFMSQSNTNVVAPSSSATFCSSGLAWILFLSSCSLLYLTSMGTTCN